MEEIWKDIPENAGCEASSFGNIRKDGIPLTPKMWNNGYLHVSLGKLAHYSIHRLVLWAFTGELSNRKKQINHIDCDKLNNRLDNLEFTTASENMQHAYNSGRHHGSYSYKESTGLFLYQQRANEKRLKRLTQ